MIDLAIGVAEGDVTWFASRVHVRLEERDGSCLLVAVQSNSGTLVNGARIDDDTARGDYLRALDALTGWDFDQRAALGELAARVDPAWRLALALR